MGVLGPSRYEVQQSGVDQSVRVAGVVYDSGDYAESVRAVLRPGVLIIAKGVDPFQPVGCREALGGFGVDRDSGCVPGEPELVARAETEVSKYCRASVAHLTPRVVSLAGRPVVGQSGSEPRQTCLAPSARAGLPR